VTASGLQNTNVTKQDSEKLPTPASNKQTVRIPSWALCVFTTFFHRIVRSFL